MTSRSPISVLRYLTNSSIYMIKINNLGLSYFLASKGQAEFLALFLENGLILDKSKDILRYSPLFAAATYGSKETVELLLHHGANPNQILNGQPIIYSAINKRFEIDMIDPLLKQGVEINISLEDKTPLVMYVLEKKNKDLTQKFLNYVNPNMIDERTNLPVIFTMIQNRNDREVQFFSIRGLNLTIPQ